MILPNSTRWVAVLIGVAATPISSNADQMLLPQIQHTLFLDDVQAGSGFPVSVVSLLDDGSDVVKNGRFETVPAVPSLELMFSETLDQPPPIESVEETFNDAVEDDAIGSHFYVLHEAGAQLGSARPYTAIGSFQPFALENGLVFATAQFLLDNYGAAGGGVALGRRWYQPELDRVFGMAAAYDLHKTARQETAQQFVLSVESRGDRWDVFANGYLPVDQGVRQAGLRQPGNLRFVGYELMADLMDIAEIQMSGVDMQIQRRLGQRNIWCFAGWYHFQGGTRRTNGVTGGLYGYVTERLALDVTLNDDPLFETNVAMRATYFFGGTSRGRVSPPNTFRRMAEPLRRRNLSVIHESMIVEDSVPLTDAGVPITITHVQAGAGGANTGTFADPFANLPATQPTDIVYVHADGVFNNQSYTLAPGQRLFGEGDGRVPLVMTDQFGPVALPTGSGGVSIPVIQNSAADALMVNNAGEVANIRITNPAMAGIRIINSPAVIRDVTVEGGTNSVAIVAQGGGSSHVVLDNNMLLGATNAGVTATANNTGSQLSLTMIGNVIDTQGVDSVDSLFLQNQAPDAQVFLFAEGNTGDGGTPDDSFRLINNTGNPAAVRIRAANAMELGEMNGGVNVIENPNAAAFQYDAGLAIPTP